MQMLNQPSSQSTEQWRVSSSWTMSPAAELKRTSGIVRMLLLMIVVVEKEQELFAQMKVNFAFLTEIQFT